MSALTDRLRLLDYFNPRITSTDITDAADLIDAIDALHVERRYKVVENTMPSPNMMAGYMVWKGFCDRCREPWPCSHHLLIHPEDDGMPMHSEHEARPDELKSDGWGYQ